MLSVLLALACGQICMVGRYGGRAGWNCLKLAGFFAPRRIPRSRRLIHKTADRGSLKPSGSFARASRVGRAILLVLAAPFFFPLSAFSQVAPSLVTPETVRPAPLSAPELELSRGEGLEAPAGADRLSFTAGHIAIEGGFRELGSQSGPLVKTIEERLITLAELYRFANALEQIYARAGYILVRVTLPAQALKDHGDVRLVVTDGFIERVQINNIPERARRLLARRTAWLIRRRHIKLEEIERVLLLAGDVPGLRLQSTLMRGKTPGGVLFILEGTQHLVTGGASLDNGLPTSSGSWRYGVNAALNSPFGFGEQFYFSALTGGAVKRSFDFHAPYRVLGVGAVLPLGLDGWILNPEYTNSRSQPRASSGGVASVGDFERFALRSSYPLLRTRAQTITLSAAYEYNSQNVTLPLFATDLNKDRYEVVRLGVAYQGGPPALNAVFQASGMFSQGVGGRDSANAQATGIPLSRQGSGPYFTKAVFDSHFVAPLFLRLRLDVYGSAQSSFGVPVPVSEQFSMDGPQAVSGYPNGTLTVDEGGSLRAEISRPFAVPDLPAVLNLSPYVFGAFGAGQLDDPTASEIARVQASSYGIGLRGGPDPGGYQGFSLSIELARQESNLPDAPQNWRVNANVGVQF